MKKKIRNTLKTSKSSQKKKLKNSETPKRKMKMKNSLYQKPPPLFSKSVFYSQNHDQEALEEFEDE